MPTLHLAESDSRTTSVFHFSICSYQLRRFRQKSIPTPVVAEFARIQTQMNERLNSCEFSYDFCRKRQLSICNLFQNWIHESSFELEGVHAPYWLKEPP